MSIPVNTKRAIGRPPGREYRDTVAVRFKPEQLAELDAWIAAQSDKPSRSEAIRRLVEQGLSTR